MTKLRQFRRVVDNKKRRLRSGRGLIAERDPRFDARERLYQQSDSGTGSEFRKRIEEMDISLHVCL